MDEKKEIKEDLYCYRAGVSLSLSAPLCQLATRLTNRVWGLLGWPIISTSWDQKKMEEKNRKEKGGILSKYKK